MGILTGFADIIRRLTNDASHVKWMGVMNKVDKEEGVEGYLRKKKSRAGIKTKQG